MKAVNISPTISEYILKDGRRLSVMKEGGTVTGWKRYTTGVVEICDARYIKDKTVSGVAHYNMFGQVQSIKLKKIENKTNSKISILKKILMDYKENMKTITKDAYLRVKNGKLIKLSSETSKRGLNPGIVSDERQIITRLENNI